MTNEELDELEAQLDLEGMLPHERALIDALREARALAKAYLDLLPPEVKKEEQDLNPWLH